MAEEFPRPRRPEEEVLIVLVPFPAQGHVTPMVHLGAALRLHGFRSVLVLPASIQRRLSPEDSTVVLGRSPADASREVVIASIPDGVAEGKEGEFFSLVRAMEEIMPAHFEELLRSLENGRTGAAGDGEGGGCARVACVVVDLLASWAMEVSYRCNIPVAGFWPAMLATYRLLSAARDLVEHGLISTSGIPRCQAAIPNSALPCSLPTLSTADLPWLVGDVASQEGRFAFWQRTLDRSRTLPWLLVNTFASEGTRSGGAAHGRRLRNRNDLTCCSAASLPGGRPRVYRVGPLSAARDRGLACNFSFWKEDRSCVQWLDAQVPGSVVYVSFGSWVGPMGDGSVRELALGLEATGRPFLWVLGDSLRAGLPEEFADRTASSQVLGKLVRWAPQTDVLRHAAVGCFLTHCGWNSVTEGMRGKKRLLCYPVAGDQFLNCRYIVDEWRVGLRLQGMRREAVRDGVERAMGAEGEELQRRVGEMSEEMNGQEGKARAAAELAAFVEQLNIFEEKGTQ